MPPPFATTSPVAVAATRILAAYLSNHKLSPTEAANLSGTIVEALGRLVGGADAGSASAAEPELWPARQDKPRRARRAVAAEAEDAASPGLLPASPPPVEPPAKLASAEQPEADAPGLVAPLAEPRAPEPSRIELIAAPEPEASADEPEVTYLLEPEPLPLFADEGGEGDGVRPKRKRPSRPRSKRGQGGAAAAIAAAMAEFMPDFDVAEDLGPADENVAAAYPAAAERETAEGPVAVEATPPVAEKPRRPGGRPRRVTTT